MIQPASSQAAPHPSALFERALIVEDLDEPRQWLAEILPQVLPSVRRVDAAATLAQARGFMGTCTYGLALVAARSGAVVRVSYGRGCDVRGPPVRANQKGSLGISCMTIVAFPPLSRIKCNSALFIRRTKAGSIF